MNANFKVIAQTDEKPATSTYRCITFIDSFNFMGKELEILLKLLKYEDFILTRKILGDRWEFVKQKTSDSFEAFETLSNLDKPITNLKLEDCYSSLTEKTPHVEATIKIIKSFTVETGQKPREIKIWQMYFLIWHFTLICKTHIKLIV